MFSEDSFLQQLFPQLGTMPADVLVGSGDDCAAIQAGPGEVWLLGMDQVIGDRHYWQSGDQATSAELVGRKLLARNLSDIAAMGGIPKFALVSVAMSPQNDQAWLTAFHAGLLALARQFEVVLVGGDLARAPQDSVAALTIVGKADPSGPVCRTGAAVGDLLYLTGSCGASLVTGHHLHFTPRCRQGGWLARQRWTKAMIDLSDGLLLDARRLACASEVRIRLNLAAVPRRTAQVNDEAMLSDGEDYELLFAVEASRSAELETRWPFADVPLTCIGEVVAGEAGTVVDRDGALLTARGGFDHLSGT